MIPLHVTAWEFFLGVLAFSLKVLAVGAGVVLTIWLITRAFHWLRDTMATR